MRRCRAGWRPLVGRVGAVLGLIAVLLVVPIGGASAHTALLGSDPAAGERLAYSPQEVLLTFASPVDPATLTVALRDADGGDVAVTPQQQPTGDVSAIAYDLPRLAQGIYGLTWESVGADGHRARGEVLFGVGVAPSTAGSLPGAPADRLATGLDAAAGLVRILWYLALAAAASVVVLQRPHGSLVAALIRRRRRAVALGLAATALLRGGVGAAIIAQAGGGARRALLGRSTLLWLVAALIIGGWGLHRRRSGAARTPLTGADRDSGDKRGVAGRAAGQSAGLWLFGLAVLAGVLAGHAPDRPDPVLAVAFGVAHLGAAAVWIGPLVALLLATRTPAWRALPPSERREQLGLAMRSIVPAAGWALAVVATSGGLLALRTWQDGGLPAGTFSAVLVAKSLVVVAVVLPLGALHHRRRRGWEALPPTLRVEAAGLVVALALGSVLVGVDPGWRTTSGGADQALAALLDGRAQDPTACANLDVGRAACYRTSLAGMLLAEGPQAAIDMVAALSQRDDYVADNCHQVAHDLGNDAAEQISDMADALAVEGSVCWSGYYHGFVEARLASVDDADLVADLPSFCDGAADVPYSFTHYNCVHGLGHGLMLRVDADLFAALPLCQGLDQEWTIRSCASGAFMENVMAAQQGVEAAFDDDDLLYPCTAIEGAVTEDCYLMQTSHILWRLEGDIAGAFAWCDTAPTTYQTTCYRSMGRDISGRSSLDVATVVADCHLGNPQLTQWCFDGAASNAVYETADTAVADRLCAAVQGEERQRCTAARDQAASTVAAG